MMNMLPSLHRQLMLEEFSGILPDQMISLSLLIRKVIQQ